MTALLLPTSPLPKSASPRPLVYGGWQSPALGADDQWLGRLGNRWALDIVTDNLKPEPDGRAWTSVLRRAWLEGATVLYPWLQPGLVVAGSGAPVVDGAGQTGSVLIIRGFTPNYHVSAGQFFSLIHAGRRYVHSAVYDDAGDIGSDGRTSMTITPMLRIQPADGDTIEFDTPMIEGKVVGNSRQWTMIPARVQGLTFSIEEIA